MLAASALWRWEAPAMVRSSASWGVSNSTGTVLLEGKRGAVLPWTSRGSILGAHSRYRTLDGRPLGSRPDLFERQPPRAGDLRAAVDRSGCGPGVPTGV